MNALTVDPSGCTIDRFLEAEKGTRTAEFRALGRTAFDTIPIVSDPSDRWRIHDRGGGPPHRLLLFGHFRNRKGHKLAETEGSRLSI